MSEKKLSFWSTGWNGDCLALITTVDFYTINDKFFKSFNLWRVLDSPLAVHVRGDRKHTCFYSWSRASFEPSPKLYMIQKYLAVFDCQRRRVIPHQDGQMIRITLDAGQAISLWYYTPQSNILVTGHGACRVIIHQWVMWDFEVSRQSSITRVWLMDVNKRLA